MTRNELNEMTVLALRKLAKENKIVLGAGIDKAGIIEKLGTNWQNQNTRPLGTIQTRRGSMPVRLTRPRRLPARVLPGRIRLLPASTSPRNSSISSRFVPADSRRDSARPPRP